MVIEQKIINKLIKRDEDAFEFVYHQTKRGVYGIMFAIVKSHAVTEDLMQDVYMKMMTSIHNYEKNTKFYQWLLQIARNAALDYYRRNQKQIHVDANDFDQTFTSHEQLPDEETKFNQLTSMLTEEEKTIVYLKIVDDMKHKDIAKLLDKPVGTIQYLYHEAIEKMKSSEGIK